MFAILPVIIIILLVPSAFWSGTETALTSLSTSRVKKLITMHPACAATMRQWLEKPYHILTIILVGNTFTNMGVSSFAAVWATEVFATLPRSAVESSTWIIVTFMLLVFGEITPKVYARRRPEMVSVVVLPIYEFLLRVFQPAINVIEFILRRLAPGKKIVPFGRMAQFSIEEIRQLFDESNLAGMLGADTTDMVEKVFKLGETDVTKIMTPIEKVEGVCLDCKEDAGILDKFIETGHSRIPIVKTEPYRIIGYVHIKDILKQLSADKTAFDEEIIRTAYIVPRDKKVSQLLKEFQSGSFHMAVVSDEQGRPLGLVTLEDVLEELVGEIVDEYDIISVRQ